MYIHLHLPILSNQIYSMYTTTIQLKHFVWWFSWEFQSSTKNTKVFASNGVSWARLMPEPTFNYVNWMLKTVWAKLSKASCWLSKNDTDQNRSISMHRCCFWKPTKTKIFERFIGADDDCGIQIIWYMKFCSCDVELCITYISRIHTLPTNDEYEIILLQRIALN